jgi:hypothetical protein
MSGKGRFAKKGQGKGKSQTKGGNSNVLTANKKQFVTDFNYYLGSSKQASDYETTTEFLINHIKKLYDYGNDIGTALEKLESVDTVAPKKTKQKGQLSSSRITTHIEGACRFTRTTSPRRTHYCGNAARKQ